MYKPLSDYYDDYNGRNYDDIAGVIEKLITKDIDYIIHQDIVGMIAMYCGEIKCDRWLDIVCNDGIGYIKQKFASIKADVMIHALKISEISTFYVLYKSK